MIFTQKSLWHHHIKTEYSVYAGNLHLQNFKSKMKVSHHIFPKTITKTASVKTVMHLIMSFSN